jgi:hypothetical protein
MSMGPSDGCLRRSDFLHWDHWAYVFGSIFTLCVVLDRDVLGLGNEIAAEQLRAGDAGLRRP